MTRAYVSPDADACRTRKEIDPTVAERRMYEACGGLVAKPVPGGDPCGAAEGIGAPTEPFWGCDGTIAAVADGGLGCPERPVYEEKERSPICPPPPPGSPPLPCDEGGGGPGPAVTWLDSGSLQFPGGILTIGELDPGGSSSADLLRDG